jgi:UDP-3-O-[3-hydroxymyristoyl] glucosamine N-acyltransferase
LATIGAAMKLKELADALECNLEGDGSVEITGVAGIEQAQPGHLTFVANVKYAPLARSTRASAVLVTPEFPAVSAAMLRTAHPSLRFAEAIDIFYKPPAYPPGIHPTAQIAVTARIGKNAHVGAYAVIMDGVQIGDRARILPHVVIYPSVSIGDDFFAHAHSIVRENSRLGNNVLLQNGAIVGSDGFGFAKDTAGHWRKTTQAGSAVLEDDIEIQALSCIDRATVGETRLGAGVKVDNLVQVGHNSQVGADSLLCAQAGLAGTSELGKGVILAGQAGVAGHCKLGDGVILTAQSGISHDVAPGKIMSGSPAFDNRQWLRSVSIFARLPDLVRRWNSLLDKAGADPAEDSEGS